MADGSLPETPPTRLLAPPTSAPAGWYRDPAGYPIQRYFDGRAWTTHTTSALLERSRDPHPVLPAVAAIGAIIVLALSLIASQMVAEQLVQFDWPIAVYVGILIVVGYGPSVWWIWFASKRWGTGRVLRDIGVAARWSDLGWGPLIWLTAIASELLVVVIIEMFDIPLIGNLEGVGELDLDRTYVISMLVTAVIAAPLVEEALFRGVILRGFLSRMGPVFAVGAQGVIFGAVHADPSRGTGNIGLVMVLGAVGIAFGGAAYFLRRIGPTILAHAIFNAVVMAVVLND